MENLMTGPVQYEFERPLLTVDVALFTMVPNRNGAKLRNSLYVMLPVRTDEPFKGKRGLVGTVIHTNEDQDTHAAAKRGCRTKLGMEVSLLEQLAMFSGPDRDPRGWSATLAHIATVKWDQLTPDQAADFFPVDALPQAKNFQPVANMPEDLAFDHSEIVYWAVQRIRNKASYTTIPLFLMAEHFTLYDLQKSYEGLMNQEINTPTFRRKIEDLDIIEPTGDVSDSKVTGTRAAALYRAKHKTPYFFPETLGWR